MVLKNKVSSHFIKFIQFKDSQIGKIRHIVNKYYEYQNFLDSYTFYRISITSVCSSKRC